jgi:aryl-alcohol dehydrogenase-like predicted oxidoreductase
MSQSHQAHRADPGSSARPMSTFPLGPRPVRRSGYGAMQLAGPWAVNAPPDRASAIGVLREAVTLGIDHIDTAQYYGPDIVNDLIREALHPYPRELAIVSKVGVFRDTGHDARQLREGIEDNLRSLRVGQLAAVNLRLPSPGRVDARFDDQLAAMVQARDEGIIAGVGLSNVSLEQLRHAADRTEIACVQNLFHLADRGSARSFRSASAVESPSCRSARSACRAARPTRCSPVRWSSRRPPALVSPHRRSRCSGCCSWHPTCC